MDYILMNKDEPCALFSCAQDEFGEESAVLREWHTDLRPIACNRSRRGLRSAERPNDANIWSSFSSSTAVSVWRTFCV